MLNMKALIVLSLCILGISGHTYFSSITIDGVAKAEGECMRPHPGSKYDYPISALDRPNGLQSNDMTCGWLPAAATPAKKKCPVNPGSSIVVQWHYEMGLGDRDTFYIDPSHKGPCIVYMAKSESGSGNVWFKIFEDGYDQNTKKWCVDKLRANKGRFNLTIPTDITPGNYLFRAELIALHEGHEMYGAQPYVGCAEITVGGSGTVDPPNKVAFPGAYTASDKGIFFNPYTGKNPAYPIPGPAIYRSGSGSASGSTPPPARATTGKPAAATTGRRAPATTGRTAPAPTPLTTGRVRPTPPATPLTTGQVTPTPTPTNPSTGTQNQAPCTLGYQRCASDNTFQTCGWATQTITGWSVAQSCPAGLKCYSVMDNYVWCY